MREQDSNPTEAGNSQIEEVALVETDDKKARKNSQLLQKWYQYILTESPKILPIAYLCMIGIGMIFNYYKYKLFGVNIFQFASVFDFLIAPFEDAVILFFTFFSLIFCIFIIYIDYWTEKKYPKVYHAMSFNQTKKKKYPAFRFGVYILLILAYIWLAATIYGEYSYYKILKQQDIHVVYYNNETTSGKQIGKSGDVIFLLGADETTKVIPINSLVKEIRYNND